MSDAEDTTGPRPVHDRCSAAEGSQAPGDDDRSAGAIDPNVEDAFTEYEKMVARFIRDYPLGKADKKTKQIWQAEKDIKRQNLVDAILDQAKKHSVTEGP